MLKKRRRGGARGRESSERGPMPAYNLMSEKLRRSSSGSVQCSLFCGGQNCKYESPLLWSPEDMAVRGVYSHWVTDDILAMARPSTALFKVYDIIEQFKSAGVASVINLQCPWEHSRCGPGLDSCGFTYDPTDLMKEGVYFYNFGWSDYSVPTLSTLLDAVKVLDHSITVGRVAVHCHAGLGRTGLLIACHLIYSQRTPPNQAITHVRVKRPGSIQTRTQIELVQRFGQYLSTLWTLHPSLEIHHDEDSQIHQPLTRIPENEEVPGPSGKVAEPVDTRLTFEDLLRNQSLLLHGEMQVELKQIPKVINDVCVRIMRRSHESDCDVITHCLLGDTCQVNPVMLGCLQVCCYDEQLESDILPSVHAIQTQMNCSLDWSLLRDEVDIRVLLGLLSTFFSGLKAPLLAPEHVSLLVTSSKLTTLPPSHLHTITQLLSTLHTLVAKQLRCTNRQCLVNILAQLCSKLASLIVQSDHTNELHYVPTVADVLLDYCLKTKSRSTFRL